MAEQEIAQVEACAVALDGRADEVRERALERLVSLDEGLLKAVERQRRPLRTALARTLTSLGNARSWVVAGVALLATRTALGIHLGSRLAAATLIATLAAQALKRGLTRKRPNSALSGFLALAENPDRFSFPSGHTAAAFSVAVAFAGEPFGLGAAALILASGVGLSRVYLGAHYPSDVVGGAVLGSLSGLLARLLVVG